MYKITQEQYNLICREERDVTINQIKDIESDDIQQIILSDIILTILDALNNYVATNDVILPAEAVSTALKIMADEHSRVTKRIQNLSEK